MLRPALQVILAGEPCQLYLDLEFHKPSNPGLDGAALTAQLVTLLCDELALLTGEEAAQVTELDSTTADKFSRHVCICTATSAFASNDSVGRFVRGVLSRPGVWERFLVGASFRRRWVKSSLLSLPISLPLSMHA